MGLQVDNLLHEFPKTKTKSAILFGKGEGYFLLEPVIPSFDDEEEVAWNRIRVSPGRNRSPH